MARTKKILSALLCLLPAAAAADDWGGSLGLEARRFYQSPQFANTLSGALNLNFTRALPGDKTRLAGELFTRKDRDDDARSHHDLRELYYEAVGSHYEFRAGNRRVYWGVTEARHLVDLINQSDFVEDLDNRSKLGQPMLSYNWIGAWGAAEFFLMPYQRARSYPGPRGHPQLPFPVDADDALYQSPRKQHHLDGAVRYRQSFGALDLGLAYFDGTAREPRILPCLRRGSGFAGTGSGPNCDIFSGIRIPQSPLPGQLTPFLQALGLAPSDEEVAAQITQQVLANIVLVPDYRRLKQFSLDAQYVLDAWAFKLEALTRDLGGGHSLAAVGGFEYTLGDAWNSGWDVGVLAEYLYDQNVDLVSSRYDHDYFFGTRWSANDIAGTQILAGGIVDKSRRQRAWQLEASRRLNDSLKATLKWRAFAGGNGNPYLDFLQHEDLLSLTLEYFF